MLSFKHPYYTDQKLSLYSAICKREQAKHILFSRSSYFLTPSGSDQVGAGWPQNALALVEGKAGWALAASHAGQPPAQLRQPGRVVAGL
jgi:hypothetical protein